MNRHFIGKHVLTSTVSSLSIRSVSQAMFKYKKDEREASIGFAVESAAQPPPTTRIRWDACRSIYLHLMYYTGLNYRPYLLASRRAFETTLESNGFMSEPLARGSKRLKIERMADE